MQRVIDTHIASRLQTLDHGAPVSPFTVSRELGHGSREMVERVYGHLGVVRHRSEVVEYRVEQHAAALADRLPRVAPGLRTALAPAPAPAAP
jgi:hypothetical protein